VRPVTLDDEDIEAIADRLVAKLGRIPSAGWVGVEEVAARLGVDADWVYRRWRALGGVKLGTAQNSPVRFDLERAVEQALQLGGRGSDPGDPVASARATPRGRP
jgi:hypothetical protein